MPFCYPHGVQFVASRGGSLLLASEPSKDWIFSPKCYVGFERESVITIGLQTVEAKLEVELISTRLTNLHSHIESELPQKNNHPLFTIITR